MISNVRLLPVTVEMILRSPHEFHLTGSRFFGGVHEKSDWDFFALYSQELRAQLLEFGFKKNNDETYSGDTEVFEVLSKNCIDPATMSPVKVDIQLLRSLDKKVAVQEALKKTFSSGKGLPGDKAAQRCLWFAAYAGYDAGQTLD